MSEHALFSEGMQEIVESFVVETQELLEELNEDLMRLETADDTAPLVDKIFRAVHTIKGTSSFLGVDQLNSLAHHVEDALNVLRKSSSSFPPSMMDVLFAASDHMSELLQQVVRRDIQPIDLDAVISGLIHLVADLPCGDGATELPHVVGRAADGPKRRSTSPPVGERASRRSGSVRVDIDRLDDLIDLVGELTASRSGLVRLVEDLETTYGPIPQIRELYLNSHRIDELAGAIRSVVLATRMVPVERVFGKFPRVARDLGRSLNKDIHVEFRGADTLIDRAVADEIGEPLLHLIRNAIDHGIEPRDVRVQRDKPFHGTILLEACQIDQRIDISIHDDGRGLDPEAIRRRGVAVGLIGPNEIVSERDLFDFIWKPGFSTTDVVNRISGRGVGLDVVHATVQRLNGSIEVQSDRDRGTRIRLSLPQTVSMQRCLIVDLNGQTVALPQAAVEEVFTLTESERYEPTLKRNELTVHVFDAADLHGPIRPSKEGRLAAILLQDGLRCALRLDRLVGQEDVVHHRGVAQAKMPIVMSTVALRDGSSIPLLDPQQVIASALRLEAGS